eukprot:gb/GECG01006697.1/.p1 GENE.gb/GECG01006697.1/~~gb/GECG01006697.1/.p1  ORF type:complete len:125 (+),score=18.12 gb/GECG01006697.1/:1-375(+)
MSNHPQQRQQQQQQQQSKEGEEDNSSFMEHVNVFAKASKLRQRLQRQKERDRDRRYALEAEMIENSSAQEMPDVPVNQYVLGVDNLEDFCARLCLLLLVGCLLWVLVSHIFGLPLPRALRDQKF